ncbi:MAG: hypothetical protein M3680_34840, partial [Myxococcota bacterium]|nr:hypothetical protein [Myxococcota bacterium]
MGQQQWVMAVIGGLVTGAAACVAGCVVNGKSYGPGSNPPPPQRATGPHVPGSPPPAPGGEPSLGAGFE